MDRDCSKKGTWGVLSAWALAFGCTVGWDAVAMPWSTFLPKAGPLGTMLGLVVGGLVMVVIAWNFHYMINRRPGPGGVYAYATEAFGHDHGYLCAWFLCLTYVAIVASDTAVVSVILHYIFGAGFLDFWPLYEVAGFKVCFGDILIAAASVFAMVVICYRRRFSAIVQTVLAVVLVVGFVVCFSGAAAHHGGGVKTLLPLFSPKGGLPFFQFLNILTIAPWLFIGFEAISCMTPEFKFPLSRSFAVMVAAIVTAVVAYVLLTAIPVLMPGGAAGGWSDAIMSIADPNTYAFGAARRAMGGYGDIVMACTLIGAVFTNIVGNTVVASRLLSAMADDGALPSWVGRRDGALSARNSVLMIAGIAVATSFLGQKVIAVIVDVALIGAAVAYAYTSAAAFSLARREGNRLASVTGFVGFVLSVMIGLLFLLPVFSSEVNMMATESYLVLVLWGIVGIVFFLLVFRHDALRRFGKSSVVWISLLVMIFALSLIWVRQTTSDAADAAYDAIISYHQENCTDGDGHVSHMQDSSWRSAIRKNLSIVKDSVVRNSYVQGVLNLLALALMFCLYSILRRRERELEQEKARSKSYFFSTVSHDIRTPLNAIIGFSEMLKNGLKTDEERAQALESILVSGKTLLGLINDVLDLSKLESGKMDILPEPTDFQRLAQELVDAFRLAAGGRGIELRCSVGALPPLMVDPQRIRQIVFNLIGNAVKFTKEGHVELRASYEADDGEDTGNFVLEVEDTGCGIGEDDLRRIGSAYVQVGSKLSRNGGTGLGLAICHQLATAMGGTLTVKSELGRGSTFTLALPGVVRAPKAAADSAAPRQDSPAAASGRDLRVLLVDDMDVNLMVLGAQLKQMGGVETETASDGAKALEVLKAHSSDYFDMVLTDMWMPNMDGVELVRAIRGDAGLSHLRVVVVTADVEMRKRAAEMGFDNILLKPVTGEKLRDLFAWHIKPVECD